MKCALSSGSSQFAKVLVLGGFSFTKGLHLNLNKLRMAHRISAMGVIVERHSYLRFSFL